MNGSLNNVGVMTDKEKKTAVERLARLKSELDSKRLAIKNIKIALDSLDVTE
jgi:sulfur dioxygenase